MQHNDPRNRASPGLVLWGAFGAAMILGAALRLREFSRLNLWEDEIIAATHAVQPLPVLLLNVIRNDVHPPLYFLQLHLWALISQSDAWLVANSVLWGVLAIGAVWYAADRLYGRKAGMAAAMAFALMPTAIAASQLVRMYPMLSVLIVLSFIITERTLVRATHPLAGMRLIGLSLSNLAIVATHILGMVAVFFLGLYGLWGIWRRDGPRSELRKWLCLYGGLAVVASPLVVSAVLRDPDSAAQSAVADLVSMLQAISAIVVGASAFRSDAALVVGLSLVLGFVLLGLAQRRSRALTFGFLVAPVATALIIGVLGSPMYKPPFFASLGLPFAAIALGIFAQDGAPTAGRARAGPWRSAVCFVVLPAILLAATLMSDRLNWKATDFKAAATLLRAELRPGDVVYVPQYAMFWGISWYLVGPNWGSPLAVAEPPNPKWQRVYRLLGPSLTDRLGLVPRTQSIDYAGGKLVIGYSSLSQVIGAPRVWLVTYKGRDPRPDTIGELQRLRSEAYRGLQLDLFGPPRAAP